MPLLAALEGVDVADIELEDGYRALLAEIPEEKSGWNFGDLPLVSLTMTDGDLHLYLVTDDHFEHVLTYNWGMTVRIVVGSSSVEAVDPAVIDLVGDRPALREIAATFPEPMLTHSWQPKNFAARRQSPGSSRLSLSPVVSPSSFRGPSKQAMLRARLCMLLAEFRMQSDEVSTS